jgi:DNA-binding winged helix-turn-helix (wHTH) protein/TolB-like protein
MRRTSRNSRRPTSHHTKSNRVTRFGVFQFDPASGELSRDGAPVRLQSQPAKVLAVLVARHGQIVSRDQLQREVWGSDTHVDFERGLNFCIAQVRTALGDSASSPRFVETIPTQGYRFIAPVRLDPSTSIDETSPDAELVTETGAVRRRNGRWWGGLIAATVAVAVLVAWTIQLNRANASSKPTVVVIPFYNETGRPDLDATARAIGDAVVARLAVAERTKICSVIGNAPVLRNPFARADVQEIGRTLGATHLVIGQLQSDGARLRLTAHLVRVEDMKHLWAGPFEDDRFLFDAQARTAESIATTASSLLSTPH